MKEAFKDPKVLSEAFHKRAGIDQALDRVELITLLKEDLGMHMSHAELEMMMTRIDGKSAGGSPIGTRPSSFYHFTSYALYKFHGRKYLIKPNF